MTRQHTSNNPKSKIQNVAKHDAAPSKSKILLLALALAILVIPAASPFFGDGVPRTNDLFPHLYRTFALGRALMWDGLWPRWSPELVHGYGYPVFNFFPSLSHMLIYGVHKLGFTLPNAYRIVVYLHLYTAALTSYALGRTLFNNTLSGYLAAAAYTYSPYLLYDIHVRGSVPETQTLALLPLLILGLWHLTHSYEHPSWMLTPWLPLTALTFAALLLTHHATLFQLCFPIGLWLLLQTLTSLRPYRNPSWVSLWVSLKPLWLPLLALLLGGLLGAFFALPALLEISATRASISISQGYTYESNFLTLAQLVDWPSFPADPALVNPPVVRPLPLVALTAAYLLILLRWRALPPTTKRTIGLWTAVLAITIFLITPTSTFIWRNIYLLQMTLYPWRLISIASLIAAILIAAAVQPSANSASSLTSRYLSFIPYPRFLSELITLLPFLLPPLLLLTTLPWLFPPREPLAETITQATVSGFEIPPFFIGTTTLGEFLPAWVEELPDSATQQAALIAAENPDRLQRPQGVTATWLNNNPINAHYTITAAQPTTLTYNQFYFPGWQVQLDNQQVDITPSTPHGLITFQLAAGQHDLYITFATTPLRHLATIISLTAALITLTLIIISLRYGHPLWTPSTLNNHNPWHSQGMPLLTSLFTLAIFLLITYIPTPLHRPTLLPNGILHKPPIEPLDYAGELRLLTFEQSADTITAAEPVELTLYWQPQRGIGVEYVVGVQIVDQNGVIWSEQEVTRPDDWRFVAGDEPWPRDGYRMDPFILRLLDGAPPQTYQFLVGLVQKNTNQTVAAHTFGQLTVTQPANGNRPLEDGLQPHHSTAAGLTLLGSRTDRTAARPGDPMRVTTLWQITDPTLAENNYTLALISANGETLHSQPQAISPTPPTQWRMGDRFRSAPVFRLSADLPSGNHTWQAQWNNQTVDLATITITAPDRIFTLPQPQHPLTATNTLSLGDDTPFTTLIGYDVSSLNPQPSTLQLTLYWQSLALTTTSYRVFVHLRTADGHIIAQSDGEPAQWTRPTTGWLPREIITDEHTLQLPPDPPPGPYTLITGLYDPATGQRLLTSDGLDALTLLTFP